MTFNSLRLYAMKDCLEYERDGETETETEREKQREIKGQKKLCNIGKSPQVIVETTVLVSDKTAAK